MKDPRASLRFILVASAVSLALLAQFFIRVGDLRWAVAPLAVAVACLVLESVRGRRSGSFTGSQTDSDAPAQLPLDLETQPVEWKFTLWGMEFTRGDIGWAVIVAACLLMGISLQNFGSQNANSFTPGWYCFGFAVIFLVAGMATLDGRMAGMMSRVKAREGLRVETRSLAPWLILGALLILAAGVRVYNLGDVPPGLWFDEADNLAHAQRYAENPGRIPVYEPSTNLPTMFLLPITALVDLAGAAVMTPRLVAAAFGVAGIVAVFLLARSFLGVTSGLMAAFFVAFMRWDIIWSRIGMHGITGVMFAALSGWLTLRAMRSGRHFDYALAGVSLGLGMWFYAPIRVFPLVLGFMLIHHLVLHRPPIGRFAVSVALMVAASLFAAAPVVQFAVENGEDFFARSESTSVFSIAPRDQWFDQIRESLKEHLLMFNVKGDPNPRHNLPDEPMLDFFMGGLFILGFFFALTRWRNTALFTMPFWVLFMILPGALTVPWESPQSLRSILVIPAVAALVAYPLGRLWATGRAAEWTVVRRYAEPVLLGVLAIIAFVNVEFYFGDQASDPRVYAEFSTADTLMARSQTEQQSRGYSIWASRQFRFSTPGAVLGSNPRVETIEPPETLPLDSTQVWHGAAVYFEPRERGFWELARAYYPDGEFDEVTPPNGGEAMFYAAFLSREQLARRQGLDVAYTLWNEPVVDDPSPVSESVWHSADGPSEYPFDLNIWGALKVDTEGEYEFQIDGSLDAYVELDGLRILGPEKWRSRVVPAVGLHSLKIVGRVSEPDEYFRLMWKPPGGELKPIPYSHLYRDSVLPLGAVGRFFTGGDESALPDAVEIAPSMNVFSYSPVIDEPHTVIWEGMLDVEDLGTHKFGVERVSGPVKFYFENDLLAQDPPSEDVEREGEVLIGAGSYPIRVEYVAETQGRSTMFKILWQPPDGDMVPIPVDSLTPVRGDSVRIIE